MVIESKSPEEAVSGHFCLSFYLVTEKICKVGWVVRK